MTDIVERLRELSGYGDPTVHNEAADEIERLRDELRAAHRALSFITDIAVEQYSHLERGNPHHVGVEVALRHIIRKASEVFK